ncbi:TonB-dependent receptor [Azospirillum sp. B4]|uniref:TonB-dependent receptor n=1 Tax=Azospirillum sp. B4 TaxID=95605 RepID=UPI00034B36F2|nr:TonB-dependent receptor [Azospirillum sp. B4]
MRVKTTRASGLVLLLASTALAPLWGMQSALAADVPPAAPAVPDTAANEGLMEILVTAQKRSENLQNVPISLQALGTATLEQHQVQSFDDYAKQLPSVSFQSFGPGQSQLFFRGISSGGDGLPFGALPTSGFYLDEIPVTTIGSLLDVHIYDVARVEALSGPQGTLYGASSLSGTLRIITNKPDTSKFSAGYDVQGTRFDKGSLGGTIEGFVNVPLSDRAAVRIVGFEEHDGGYIDNTYHQRTYQSPHTLDDGTVVNSPITVDNSKFVKKNFNDVDTYGGRVALGIDLDDDWTVTPQVIAQHQRSNGSFLYDPKAGDLQVHDYAPERNIDKWYQAALTVEGKVWDWDVLYSGGYMQRSIDTHADYSYYTVAYDAYPNYGYFTNSMGKQIDPTQYYYGHQDLTKQSHELRFSSPSANRWRVTAGLFYQEQTNQFQANYYAPGYGSSEQGSPVYQDDIFLTNVHIVDRDYAVFSQASYDILPSVTLTGGVRGFIADNTLTGFSGFASDAAKAGCVTPFPSLNSCSYLKKSFNESGETHKLNVTWQIDPDHMVYATYSTGYRPGGNNRRAAVQPYGSDTLDNYELGWKTSWFDQKLRFNGAVYYEEWNNLQYALVALNSGSVTNIYNAGDARVYGLETDITWAVTRSLTLSASGAFNDARLATDFCAIGANSNPDCASGIIAAPKGTRLPVQPRIKFNTTARYEFQLGEADSFVQGSLNHQTSTRSFLGTTANDLVGDSPGFTTVDVSMGGKIGNTTAEFYVQNLFDERGGLTRNTFSAPEISGQYARIYPTKPRLFGVKFGQKF